MQAPPFYFLYAFPFLFVGMWTLVTFMISKAGWSSLAEKYSHPEPFIGTRIGLISASINSARYNNSLILKYNEVGMYLKPIILFRAFHKPILIPWNDITKIKSKQIIFSKFKVLSVGRPNLVELGITEKLFEKLYTQFDQRIIEND
jgi:hypothetical protein